jgi:hypothetical protein
MELDEQNPHREDRLARRHTSMITGPGTQLSLLAEQQAALRVLTNRDNSGSW